MTIRPVSTSPRGGPRLSCEQEGPLHARALEVSCYCIELVRRALWSRASDSAIVCFTRSLGKIGRGRGGGGVRRVEADPLALG